MGVNNCQFIGRLGRDPEVRQMQNGEVANFSIAVDEVWKDRDGNKQERTEWVNCVAYGGLVKVISNYVHKGDLVYVAGKMKTRKWQDKNGADRWTTEIVLSDMQMLGGKRDSQPTPPRQESQASFADDGDVPFSYEAA